MKTFIQIGKEIFQLEQVSSAKRQKFPVEDVERFNLPRVQLDVRMANGDALIFTDEYAEQVWTALQASSLNITPSKS